MPDERPLVGKRCGWWGKGKGKGGGGVDLQEFGGGGSIVDALVRT